MRSKYIILAGAFLILLFFIFSWVQKAPERETQTENEITVGQESGQDFERIKAALNKTVRDLNLNLKGECVQGDNQYWCDGFELAKEPCQTAYSFRLSFGKKNYGDWANYWDLLESKTNKQKGETVSKENISGQSAYWTSLYEGIPSGKKCSGGCVAGNYKSISETASSYFSSFSLDVSVSGESIPGENETLLKCIAPPDKAGVFSASQILEKFINNIKSLY